MYKRFHKFEGIFGIAHGQGMRTDAASFAYSMVADSL